MINVQWVHQACSIAQTWFKLHTASAMVVEDKTPDPPAHTPMGVSICRAYYISHSMYVGPTAITWERHMRAVQGCCQNSTGIMLPFCRNINSHVCKLHALYLLHWYISAFVISYSSFTSSYHSLFASFYDLSISSSFTRADIWLGVYAVLVELHVSLKTIRCEGLFCQNVWCGGGMF